jgi:hypothetical protein
MKTKLCPCGATITMGQPHSCHLTVARKRSKAGTPSRPVGQSNKYTAKRVDDKPTPYVPYEWRCKFAVEAMTSITAPPTEQTTELELLDIPDQDEGGY